MYKKEFMETGRKTAITFLLLLLAPVFYIFDRLVLHTGLNFGTISVYAYAFVISIITLIFTGSIFHSEHQDHAMEYLFTLPVSKYNIVGYKLIPRFSILALLYIVYVLILPAAKNIPGSESSFFIYPSILPMIIFTLLILGFILGLIGHKNGFMKIFTIISFYVVLVGSIGIAANFINLRGNNLAIEDLAPFFWISSIIVTLIWWASFFQIVKRLDMKPEKCHVKKFARLAVPMMTIYVIAIIASLIMNKGAN